MPECPYCGKWFKTKKGLEQHITKVHKVDTPFGKALNPASFDFMGKLEREAERAKRRQQRKKSSGGFGLGIGDIFGSSKKKSGSKKGRKKKKSWF